MLKSHKIPSVAIAESANDGFIMMQWGASNMMVRNGRQNDYFYRMLGIRVRSAASKEGGHAPRVLKNNATGRVNKFIAIGSSTGGTEALASILQQMPEDAPPILIAQHMPPVFTRLYAERLDTICRISCWEAQDGDKLANGLVLIAPGDFHMELARTGDSLYVKCNQGERVCNQRPSADVLFESVARTMGRDSTRAMGVILTGMGSDGAQGLLHMRKNGAATIGQDESSSVVYGMPRAAFECGAVQRQLPLDAIAHNILEWSAKGVQ
jgi:two-component system chemotaxis response regulator CheB